MLNKVLLEQRVLVTSFGIALLALLLSGCTKEEIDYYSSLVTTGAPPADQAAPSSSSEPPRYLELEGQVGPMGEVIATGPDCTPIFRIRICV